MRDTELDIATIIDTLVAGLTAGTNLFAGPTPVSPPDKFVCVRYTTGEKDGVIGEAAVGSVVYRNTVQVMVRGDRHKYKDTLDLAQAIFSALTHPNQATYLYCCVVGAAPQYAGPDDNGRHRFSFDVECEYNADVGAGAIVPLSASGEFTGSSIVLVSPNGTSYRVTVSNAGALVVTAA
jgi:hypothetical protein